MPKKPVVYKPAPGINLHSILCNANRTSSVLAWPANQTFSYLSGKNLITCEKNSNLHNIANNTIPLPANGNCLSVNKNNDYIVGLADGSYVIKFGDQSQIIQGSEDKDSITQVSVSERQKEDSLQFMAVDINSGFYRTTVNLKQNDVNSKFIDFTSDTFKNTEVYNTVIISMATFSSPNIQSHVNFFGLDNGKIAIFQDENLLGCLKYHLHEDWVRSIDVSFQFAKQKNIDNELILSIITGGQDKKVIISDVILGLDEDQKIKNFSSIVVQIIEDHDALVYTTKFIFADDDEVLDLVSSSDENFTSINFILTTSMDGSLLIYKFDTEEEKYIETARVGQLHAGNQHVGFWAAVASFDQIINQITENQVCVRAITYSGAIYQWYLDADSGELFESEINTLGGHVGQTKATDIAWSYDGTYFFTCGSDQTTRGYSFDGRQFCRPQVHGYDMNRVACIDDHQFVSCSDEKELRIFEPTKWVYGDLKKTLETSITHYEENPSISTDTPDLTSRLFQALDNFETPENEDLFMNGNYSSERSSQPILGLTNKDMNDRQTKNIEVFTEDKLSMDSLWPEKQKLYSHGNEVVTLSYSKDLDVIVSACKAKKETDAQLCIWQKSIDEQTGKKGKNYKVTQKLPGHNLTVADCKFYKSRIENCHYLISVSRDRSICIFLWNPETKLFNFKNKIEKAHSRIIWSATIVEDNQNNQFLATGSRDKTVTLWDLEKSDNSVEKIVTHKFDDSVTTIEKLGKNRLVVGFEQGNILVTDLKFEKVELVGKHNGLVKRLAYNEEMSMLLSCSEDGQVRIYDFLDYDFS